MADQPTHGSPESGNIALIGGTGFEQLPEEIYAEPVDFDTDHGSVRLLSVSCNYVEPHKLYFLPRHGAGHTIPPHAIDHRANVQALIAAGVHYVLASNAVGSLRADLSPGSFVVLDDFIDFTRAHGLTYYTEGGSWGHTDFSQPYSPRLRNCILDAAAHLGFSVLPRATYLGCSGPRYETPAEIRMFAGWGADVIGMTGLPEAVYAKEAGMEYAALAIVTNLGAGLADGPIEHGSVSRAVAEHLAVVREILLMAAGLAVGSPVPPPARRE